MSVRTTRSTCHRKSEFASGETHGQFNSKGERRLALFCEEKTKKSPFTYGLCSALWGKVNFVKEMMGWGHAKA